MLMVSINVHAQKISLPSWKDVIKAVKKGDWFYYEIHMERFNPFLNKTYIEDYYLNLTILDKTKDMVKLHFDRTNEIHWYSGDNYTLLYPLFYLNNGTSVYKFEDGGSVYKNASFVVKKYNITDGFLFIDLQHWYNYTNNLPINISIMVCINYNVTVVVNVLYKEYVVNLSIRGVLEKYELISNNSLNICETSKQEMSSEVILHDTNTPILTWESDEADGDDTGSIIEFKAPGVIYVVIAIVLVVMIVVMVSLKKGKVYERKED